MRLLKPFDDFLCDVADSNAGRLDHALVFGRHIRGDAIDDAAHREQTWAALNAAAKSNS